MFPAPHLILYGRSEDVSNQLTSKVTDHRFCVFRLSFASSLFPSVVHLVLLVTVNLTDHPHTNPAKLEPMSPTRPAPPSVNVTDLMQLDILDSPVHVAFTRSHGHKVLSQVSHHVKLQLVRACCAPSLEVSHPLPVVFYLKCGPGHDIPEVKRKCQRPRNRHSESLVAWRYQQARRHPVSR